MEALSIFKDFQVFNSSLDNIIFSSFYSNFPYINESDINLDNIISLFIDSYSIISIKDTKLCILPIDILKYIINKDTNIIWNNQLQARDIINIRKQLYSISNKIIDILYILNNSYYISINNTDNNTFFNISQYNIIKYLGYNLDITYKTMKELKFTNSYVYSFPRFSCLSSIYLLIIEMINKNIYWLSLYNEKIFKGIISIFHIFKALKENKENILDKPSSYLLNYNINNNIIIKCNTDTYLNDILDSIKSDYQIIEIIDSNNNISYITIHDIYLRVCGYYPSFDLINDYGDSCIKSFNEYSILISGINGIGIEVLKNLLYFPFSSITLHDIKQINHNDLYSNYLLTSDDIGNNRALCSFNKLYNENIFVKLNIYCDKIQEDIIKHHDIIIINDSTLQECIEINNICHKFNKLFIRGTIKGLIASIFSDFGNEFKIENENGNENKRININTISNDGIVCCENNIPFNKHDRVIFQNIRGFYDLNNLEYDIQVISPNSFKINNYSNSNTFIPSGNSIAIEVKNPLYLTCNTLSNSIQQFNNIYKDNNFTEQDKLIFTLCTSIDIFVEKYNYYPDINNEKHISLFNNILLNYYNDIQFDIKHYINSCDIIIIPMASIIGSLIVNEIIKYTTHQYSSSNQWIFVDQHDVSNIINSNIEYDINYRYKGIQKLLGNDILQKITKTKIFVDSNGILGYELIKNITLSININDSGCIDTNNEYKGYSKLYNSIFPSIHNTNCVPSLAKMNHKLSGNIINEISIPKDYKKWVDYDVIIGNSHKLLDICFQFDKQYIQTQIINGNRSSIDIIIPYKTTLSFEDEDEIKELPIPCGESFPQSLIDCVLFCMLEINSHFEHLEDVSQYLQGIRDFEECKLNRIYTILEYPCRTLKDCIFWARTLYQKLFISKILKLQINCPPDFKTSGRKFWLPPRTFPCIIPFDNDNMLHFSFIKIATILRAKVFCISYSYNDISYENIYNILETYSEPLFSNERFRDYSIYYALNKIDLTDVKVKPINMDNIQNSKLLLIYLSSLLQIQCYKIYSNDFSFSSFLRKINYHSENNLSASIIGGYSIFELIKILTNSDNSKNIQCNLSNNYYSSITPSPPKIIEALDSIKMPPNFTEWDKIHIDITQDYTIQDLKDYFEKEYNIILEMLSTETRLIYGFFQRDKEERLNTSLIDIIQTKTQKDITGIEQFRLLGLFSDKEENDVEIPPIFVCLK